MNNLQSGFSISDKFNIRNILGKRPSMQQQLDNENDLQNDEQKLTKAWSSTDSQEDDHIQPLSSNKFPAVLNSAIRSQVMNQTYTKGLSNINSNSTVLETVNQTPRV